MTTHTRGPQSKQARERKPVIDRLQTETVLMEERLVTLRKQLENDRKQRELKNKDKTGVNSFWANGQSGFVSTHAQQLIKDIKNSQPKKTRRFKMLSEDSLVETHTMPHPPLSGNTTLSPPDSSHSISLRNRNLATDGDEKNATSPIKNSLLVGCYDEDANAESFKSALQDWRRSGTGTNTGTMNTSTDVAANRIPLELPPFKSNSTLTYFDRLMLSKFKSGTNTSKPEPTVSDNTDTIRPSVSEYNIFYNSENISSELNSENKQELRITEVLDSGENSELEPKDDKNMHLKIVTQTDLRSFFLLGTEVTNENLPQSANQISDIHGSMISGGKEAWRQIDSINSDKVAKNSTELSSDTDSNSECSLVDFEDEMQPNFSEDEEILTLERLSNELKCGTKSGMESGTDLWTELMCHRPPSTNDFD